jgi:hypothetical protein
VAAAFGYSAKVAQMKSPTAVNNLCSPDIPIATIYFANGSSYKIISYLLPFAACHFTVAHLPVFSPAGPFTWNVRPFGSVVSGQSLFSTFAVALNLNVLARTAALM